MKLRQICGVAILTLACAAGAQDLQFTEYLGKISMNAPPLPLAADNDGRLYVGTFNGPASALYVIDDPLAEIGTSPANLTLIQTFPSFVAQRGLQSIQVTSDRGLLVSGDTGDANVSNLWKFNRVGASFAEDLGFRTASDLAPARRSAVSIISNTQPGLILANGLNDIDFFDFSGNHISGPFRVSENYMREGVYNSQDNVFYAIRNGVGSQELIRTFVQDVDTDGGTLTTSTLIADGGSNGQFGGARQNAYYYAEQNQLITLDGEVTINSRPVPPAVRVWDISDEGTSLTLAYRIEGTTETTKFTSLGDAVVSENHLFVSSSGEKAIYVFGLAPAAVTRWSSYEAASERKQP
jgi:hypothetical protein